MAVPSSRPRSVSIIGVNGWYSANHRTAVGIDSVGTKPLPRNGSRISGIGRLLAPSTVLDARPRATDSQVIANVITSENAGGGEPLERDRRWAGSRRAARRR